MSHLTKKKPWRKETGHEYAWVHGYTRSILRITLNIFWKTPTNKNKPLKCSHFSYKFILSCWSKKWVKIGCVYVCLEVCVCGVEPVTCLLGSTGPPHTQTLGTGALTLLHRVPRAWCWRSSPACPAVLKCWQPLIAVVTTVTFRNLPQRGLGEGKPKIPNII